MPTKPGIYLRGGTKASFSEAGNEIEEREIVYAIDTGEIGTYAGWIGGERTVPVMSARKDNFSINSDAYVDISGYSTIVVDNMNGFNLADGAYTVAEAGIYKFFVSTSINGLGLDDTFSFKYTVNDVVFEKFTLSPDQSSGRELSNVYESIIPLDEGSIVKFGYSGLTHTLSLLDFKIGCFRIGKL